MSLKQEHKTKPKGGGKTARNTKRGLKMSERAIKTFVSKQFGFKAVNVIPLECSRHNKEFDYIMFRVCGVEYQAALLCSGKWNLSIWQQNVD